MPPLQLTKLSSARWILICSRPASGETLNYLRHHLNFRQSFRFHQFNSNRSMSLPLFGHRQMAAGASVHISQATAPVAPDNAACNFAPLAFLSMFDFHSCFGDAAFLSAGSNNSCETHDARDRSRGARIDIHRCRAWTIDIPDTWW